MFVGSKAEMSMKIPMKKGGLRETSPLALDAISTYQGLVLGFALHPTLAGKLVK